MPSTHKPDETITLVCTVCGTLYHPRRGRAATSRACSQACARQLGTSAMNKTPLDAPPEKGSSRECLRCHRTFHVIKHGQRFCSQRCANQSRKPEAASLASRSCPQCQQLFTPPKPRQQYCSMRCYQRARERNKLERAPQECPRCHKTFLPKRARQRFCSRRCASAQAEGQAVASAPIACAWCHQPFVPKTRKQRFCSLLCQRGFAISRIKEGRRHSPEANEKRRQIQLERMADGTHPFVANKTPESARPAGVTRALVATTPPAALNMPALPASPAPATRTSSEERDLPAPPPLPPLPEGADETADELDVATEQGESLPLIFPLQGAEARSEWQQVGELREAQADKALRREAVRTPEGRTLVLAGQGSYLGVEGYALVCHQGRTHGVPAPARELLQPALHGVKRIIWIGAHGHLTGTLTLAAVAWCQREGIHLTVLDGAGMPLLEVNPSNEPHDSELRRRQWLVSSGIVLSGSPPASHIARELVRRKTFRQYQTLQAHQELPGQAQGLALFETWREWLEMERPPAWQYSIDYLRQLEGRLAFAYFRAWEGWPLHWSKPDTRRVPAHWLAARSRISPLSPSGNARHAVDPINACLNYCYACLASQCRQALLAEGFDLTGGFLHADKAGRDSLTYDLMELERGAVDDLLLMFLGKTTLHYADFAREPGGQVMLHPQLTRLLLAGCRVPQSRVDQHARWLRHFLLTSGMGGKDAECDDAPAETPNK